MTYATRPAAEEYPAFYGRYVSLVPEDEITATLESQLAETLELLASIPEERAGHRYAEGKWSIKELVGHVVDTERVFAYRALRIARGDRTPLAGFDQDAYVPEGRFDARPLADIAEEFAHVRRASIALLRGLPVEAWERAGVANENRVTVRAIAYIMAGHERAHLAILRERYL